MASMETKLRRKQRRKPSGLPFVQQHKYMLRWSAWRSLSPIERAAYIQLALRYDGVNNGSLALSARVLELELQCDKATASRALIRLEDVGFIETAKRETFARRNRKASEYRLTTYKCEGVAVAAIMVVPVRPAVSRAVPHGRGYCRAPYG
jgi:DNA-binding MarR family transcriptional regulator